MGWKWKPISLTKPTTSSENIFILRLYCTYLLTYWKLLRSGARKLNEREREVSERERNGDRGSGVTEGGMSGERKFPPLQLCSHALLVSNIHRWMVYIYVNCVLLTIADIKHFVKTKTKTFCKNPKKCNKKNICKHFANTKKTFWKNIFKNQK